MRDQKPHVTYRDSGLAPCLLPRYQPVCGGVRARAGRPARRAAATPAVRCSRRGRHGIHLRLHKTYTNTNKRTNIDTTHRQRRGHTRRRSVARQQHTNAPSRARRPIGAHTISSSDRPTSWHPFRRCTSTAARSRHRNTASTRPRVPQLQQARVSPPRHQQTQATHPHSLRPRSHRHRPRRRRGSSRSRRRHSGQPAGTPHRHRRRPGPASPQCRQPPYTHRHAFMSPAPPQHTAARALKHTHTRT